MSTIKVTAVDIIEDGKLQRIEFHNEDGGFEFQALWDETDEHTPENIEHFREWIGKIAKQKNYTIGE